MEYRLICGGGRLRTLLLLVVAWLAFVGSRAGAVDLIGYLPYYRMNNTYNTNTLPTQLSMLSEIRYFGLTASNSGTIVPLERRAERMASQI